MFHDIFANIAILISFLLVFGLTFKKNSFDSKQSYRAQILIGVIFGLLGMLLMLFTIRITDIVIIDLRNVSIMCAGILAGPFASIVAALIIGVFRLIYFGINTASVVAFTVALIVGCGAAYISHNKKQSRRSKFIYMFIFSMTVSNMVLFYLMINKDKLMETLIYYWLIYILGTLFAYLTCEYIVSSNISYKVMSYYKVISENLTDMISIHEPGGRVLFVSEPIFQMFGYTTMEYIGTSAYDYMHPDDKKSIQDELYRPMKLKDVSSLTLRMRHKDGRYIWVETNIKSIRNTDGSIKEMICISRDISYRRKIEQEIIVSNERLKAIFDNAGIGIVLTDHNEGLIDANAAYLNMLGFSKEEAKTLKNAVYPDDHDKVDEIYNNLLTKKCELDVSEMRYLDKDKQIIYAYVRSTVITGSEYNSTSIIQIVNNITEQKMMLKKLRESEERSRTAFDNAVIGMSLGDLSGKFLKANNALCELLGYSEEELLNINFQQITYPDDLEKENILKEKLLSGEIQSFIIEKRLIHKNGSIKWVLVGISIIYDIDGNPHHSIGQFQDVTNRKLAEEELMKAHSVAEKLASTDYLTGLLNRRAFQNRFNEEFSRVGRENSSISLILADIDYFKKINDKYGHQVGDIALQEFSKCLSSGCRPYDFIGRHGGEEFIICLPSTGNEQAVKIAERMRMAVENLSINIENTKEPIRITASFGVASPIVGSEESIESLILQADKAMYKAKAGGRNRVCTQ